MDKIQLYSFIFTILFTKYKRNTIALLNCTIKLFDIVKNSRFLVASWPDNLLELFFPECKYFSSESIFVNESHFKNFHGKWVCVTFFCDNKFNYRTLKINPSSLIPKNCILISNITLFNIKMCLNPFKTRLFTRNKEIFFKLEQAPDTCHREASKIVISFFKDTLEKYPQLFLYKTFQNYLKTPKFLRQGDIVTINSVSFQVISIEPSSGPANEREVFAITKSTSVFDEKAANGFKPQIEFELLNESTWKPVRPFGLSQPYLKILKWFTPFFVDFLDLLPIFILTGDKGCGKSLLLGSVSKTLGVNYVNIDCSNLLAGTQSQILAIVKSIDKKLRSNSPCIMELYNAQLLCSTHDGIDNDQLFFCLSEHLRNIKLEYPFVIVLTCEKIDQINQEYVGLSLQHYHIENPNEEQRVLIINWFCHISQIRLNKEIRDYICAQTNSFCLAEMKKVICLSEKERISENLEHVNIQHVKNILAQMSSVDQSRLKTVEWQDVGGVEAIKKEVLSSLLSRQFVSVKRTGLLLHGPPGTGKTLLARAVASQCGRAFISVKGPELLNMYVGQSEANIREVFKRAIEASPCIMFFDELDSLAPNRGNKSDSGGVTDRVVSQMLTEMDELDTKGDVFILGATNRPDLIDPALLRPGRFDKMLYVGPCSDSVSKLKVLTALTRKFKMDEVNLSDLVEKFPDEVSGANIYAVCSSAWLFAAKELIKTENVDADAKVIVQTKHFLNAISDVFRS